MRAERYNRNILIDKISASGQEKICESKILVAGAGGLGSGVIANLASLGVGFIGIIDKDKVELSNLNRQFIHKTESVGEAKTVSAGEWINQYNPEIETELYQTELDESNALEIVSKYDFVIDCFDSYKSKFLLNKICVSAYKPLIHGGVTEFYGQVKVILPGISACLECIFPDADENLYSLKGVASPAVSTIASIQAMEALKIIIGNDSESDSLLCDYMLSYNGLKQDFRKIHSKRNPECSVCGIKRNL